MTNSKIRQNGSKRPSRFTPNPKNRRTAPTVMGKGILALALEYVEGATGVEADGDATGTPSWMLMEIFADELHAHEERARRYEIEHLAEYAQAFSLIDISINFGVKLGAVITGKLQGEALPLVEELVEEFRLGLVNAYAKE